MQRFIFKTLLYGSPIIFPILIYLCVVQPRLHGDIGQLGHITFSSNYCKQAPPSDSRVIQCSYACTEFGDSSISIIGDSFSRTNESFPYYLSKYSSYQVMFHYQQWKYNPFVRFLYLSKTRQMPKIVVIETVERALIYRAEEINFSLTPEQMIATNKIDTAQIKKSSSSSPSSERSLLAVTQEWTKRKLGFENYENPIKKAILSKPYFTCPYRENELYFYIRDLSNLPASDQSIHMVASKLDSLFNYAESIGVELYIIIAADKYNVYQDFIKDNPYPRNDILERLDAIYSHPHLINTKDTLTHMVSNGIKDVYMCHDTHWNSVASEAVAIQLLNAIEQ